MCVGVCCGGVQDFRGCVQDLGASSAPLPRAKIGLAKIGFGPNWPKMDWPKMDWPKNVSRPPLPREHEPEVSFSLEAHRFAVNLRSSREQLLDCQG